MLGLWGFVAMGVFDAQRLPGGLGHHVRRSAAKNSGRSAARGVKKAAFQHGSRGSLSHSRSGPTRPRDRLSTAEVHQTTCWTALFATGGVLGGVSDIDANVEPSKNVS